MVSSLIVGELLVFMLILFAGMFVNIERWVAPSVQNAHILLLIVSLTILRLEVGVILLVLVSSVVWSYGILRLRRGLRILGLVDLAIALIRRRDALALGHVCGLASYSHHLSVNRIGDYPLVEPA